MLEVRSRSAPPCRHFLLAAGTILAVLCACSCFLPYRSEAFGSSQSEPAGEAKVKLWPLSIDYPQDGSIFPPAFTPPTFVWRDAAGESWQIDITFGDKSAPIHVEPKAERMRVGFIDPACVSNTNELPRLTPQQAASWTWTPDAVTWRSIQAHAVDSMGMVTITGYTTARGASSQAKILLATSADPVGAPIFYRDVPLMPSAGANGTVQPLSPASIHPDQVAHP